ncbi:apoptosis-antagonizing transcription factor [Rhodotorula diobovata]|uniref:Protein BFR2 n=1 Tax=Rhodotorula diobovata TaxID=5288 RepID=A0A5C5FPP8_9BASI|nr:apoptosis-antagonizing transcription factor [Rhodotorula diobovata]
MAKLTLAQQLAQISQPAPQDFDPEDAYATYADGRTAAPGDDDDGATAAGGTDAAAAARADYVEVGASKLRKRGEAVLDAKYDGKKGSRAALYGDGEDDDEEEESPAEEDDELDGLGGEEDDEGEDDDDEMGDFEDLEGASEGASEEEAASGEDEDEEEEDEEDDDAPMPPPSSTSRPSQPRSERAMVSQLQRAASADVEKGRDVKKQLAFCDSLLEARIKLQKAVGAVNSLPPPPSAESYFAEARSEVDEARREIEGLGEELFALRESLLATNEKIELPADFGASRKRKRTSSAAEDSAAYLDATLSDLAALEATFDPFLRTTVSKWSDKVLAASGLALSKDKKFKAVNQNALAQVDHALSGAGERERLVRRTRIRRGEGFPLGRAKANEGDGEAEAAPLEGDKVKAGKEVDDECFDDSDFYQQLLRDVVESRMLDLDDATLTHLRHATALARGKKVKKQVDTRASKGRKIRYHVHEKVQNFMIPIEAGDWHEEQVDELFASLLGRSFPQAQQHQDAPAPLDPALDDVAPARAGEIDVGSLRLFG